MPPLTRFNSSSKLDSMSEQTYKEHTRQCLDRSREAYRSITMGEGGKWQRPTSSGQGFCSCLGLGLSEHGWCTKGTTPPALPAAEAGYPCNGLGSRSRGETLSCRVCVGALRGRLLTAGH